MQVVSLLPSATEILYALGVEPVAVTHECDYPPAARDRPEANRSRVSGGSSADINEQVADAEENGGVYELREDVLREADPDLIVTQGVCDVCAVDGSLVRAAVDDLDLDADVLSLHSHSLDGVLEDVERIGEAVAREERAAAVVSELRDRIRTVAEAAPDTGERVAVLDWLDPVMVAGHWVPGMIETAGGEYGMAAPGQRSTPREWESVREYDPDVLVAAPCGFTIDRTLEELDVLSERAGWEDLAAVRAGRVYAMDGHGYVNRPGPRLVDTLEAFAGLLHPAHFDAPPADVARPVAGATRI